eukprot:jgi/Ulvmu1/11023/UM007_0203.1
MTSVENVCVEFRSRCSAALREMGIDPSFGLSRPGKHGKGAGAGGAHDYGETDDDTDESGFTDDEVLEDRPSNICMDITLTRRIFRHLAQVKEGDDLEVPLPFDPDEPPVVSRAVAACTSELVPYVNQSFIQSSGTMPPARAMLWNLQLGSNTDATEDTPRHRRGCLPAELLAMTLLAAQRILQVCQAHGQEHTTPTPTDCLTAHLPNLVHPLVSCTQLTPVENLLLWLASQNPLWSLGPTSAPVATSPAAPDGHQRKPAQPKPPTSPITEQPHTSTVSLHSVASYMAASIPFNRSPGFLGGTDAAATPAILPPTSHRSCLDLSRTNVPAHDIPAIVAIAHSTAQERSIWAARPSLHADSHTAPPATGHCGPHAALAPTRGGSGSPDGGAAVAQPTTASDPGCYPASARPRTATLRHRPRPVPAASADACSHTAATAQHSGAGSGSGEHITDVLLACCGLTDAAVALLSLGLSSHEYLERMDLSGNAGITEAGIHALCTLALPSPFGKLQAGGSTMIRHRPWTPTATEADAPAAHALDEKWMTQPLPLWPAGALNVPTLRLRELRLDRVPLGRGRGADTLLGTVATCSHLTGLSLRGCSIGAGAANRLRRMVELSKGLQALDVSDNRLGERGAFAIASALAHSTRLTALGLARSSLGTAGTAAIGSALQHNTALRRLDLSSNGAAAAAGLMLGRGLAAHPCLTSLLLSGNPLGETGGRAVLRAAGTRGQLRDLALHGCHLAAGCGTGIVEMFNPESPNGDYRLDLSDVNERIIASHLVHLERALGPGAWHAATLGGTPLGLSALQLEEWLVLEAVPARGVLVLQFRLPRAAVAEAVRPPPGQLSKLLQPNFAAPASTDIWRLQLLRIAVSTFCIDAACGAQIINTLRGADERVAAATSIFPTLPDPTALPALLAPLPPPQRDAVHARLGLLAFFDPGNPTGRYHLDMAVPLHRVVLCRLVSLSAQQGFWRADTTRRNLRNVIIGTREVDVPDPTVFVVPSSGHVQLDYLEYTDFVRHPRACVPTPSPVLARLRHAFAAATAASAALASGSAPRRPDTAVQFEANAHAAHTAARIAGGLRVADDADVAALRAALRTAVAWQEEEEEAAWVARIEASAAVRGVCAAKKKGRARGKAVGRGKPRPGSGGAQQEGAEAAAGKVALVGAVRGLAVDTSATSVYTAEASQGSLPDVETPPLAIPTRPSAHADDQAAEQRRSIAERGGTTAAAAPHMSAAGGPAATHDQGVAAPGTQLQVPGLLMGPLPTDGPAEAQSQAAYMLRGAGARWQAARAAVAGPGALAGTSVRDSEGPEGSGVQPAAEAAGRARASIMHALRSNLAAQRGDDSGSRLTNGPAASMHEKHADNPDAVKAEHPLLAPLRAIGMLRPAGGAVAAAAAAALLSPLQLVRAFSNTHLLSCSQLLAVLAELPPASGGEAGPPAAVAALGQQAQREWAALQGHRRLRRERERVTAVQMLFAHVADLLHFSSVMRALEPEEQVAAARRCGWLNVTPLGRRDHGHLSGLFFCLRLSREEDARLARRLAAVAVAAPTQLHACWLGLAVNGAPAAITEDERLWPTVQLFCTNRGRPDASWDAVGTLEFTFTLPTRWLRARAALQLQAALRGAAVRRRLARAADDVFPATAPEAPGSHAAIVEDSSSRAQAC